MDKINGLIRSNNPSFSVRHAAPKTADECREGSQSSVQTLCVEAQSAAQNADLPASIHAESQSAAQAALKGIATQSRQYLGVQEKNQAADSTWMTAVFSWWAGRTPPLTQTASSIQAKNVLLDRLFEKMFSRLTALTIPNQPSLFLVYAHHNDTYGKARAEIAKYLIKKLSQLRVKLYSDQTPMARPYVGLPEHLSKDGQLADILTSQLCLLPTQLRSDVRPVDKVVVCCSEVLAKYLEWPAYQDFYQQLQQAYLIDVRQRSDASIRAVVHTYSQQAGFHHVLTEMAFLQIRAEELGDLHGIIPVSLTPKSAQPCLNPFIHRTTVRIDDIPRLEQQAQTGQIVYPDQSRHAVMFKLIERLFVTSEEAKTALNQFWQAYSHFIDQLNTQSEVPTARAFFDDVEAIFKNVQTALSEQAWLPSDLSSSDLRQALYQHYYHVAKLSIQRVSGQIASLEECYINLAMVDSHAQLEKEKEVLKKQASAFTRLPSSEQLLATDYSRVISLDRLFEAQPLHDGSTGFPKRILIQGRAGIGKTTLCKKLVYDYQHHASWSHHFACVLWVPLRQLKTLEWCSFKKLLREHYFASQQSAKALEKTFRQHKDKTLFILDGLDEVVGELEDSRPLSRFLKELLSQQHVVITSRPAGVHSSLLGQLDLTLETVGFTPDNVRTYIQKFVPQANQATIAQFIRRTPLIQGLVNIPIQLDALCYSWDKLPQNKAITMSTLYEAMVDKLWRKDSIRLEKEEEGQRFGSQVIDNLTPAELKEFMNAEIYYLGYLAFKGLAAEQIEFSRDTLSQRREELNQRTATSTPLPFSFTTNLKKTSYLHTADANLPEADRHYHFVHLTFQEFFAAQFLATHLQAYSTAVRRDADFMLNQEELHAFIAAHKYHPRYEIVWWMVAGLLKGQALTDFFALLEALPRDLIGLRHQQVMMGCLNEARPQLNVNLIHRLEAEVKQWLRFETASENCRVSILGSHMAIPESLLLSFFDQLEGRQNIILALGLRSALSDDAISIVVTLLQHENENAREWAAIILRCQQTLSDDTISALITLLQHENEDVRLRATEILRHQQTLSDDTVSAVIVLLQHESEDVRQLAAAILFKRQTFSDHTTSALIALLQHENKDTRQVAATILLKWQTLSDHTTSALIALLSHKNENASKWVAVILLGQQTLSDHTISALIALLPHENGNARKWAATILLDQQTLSDDTISALIVLLRHENEDTKEWAAGILLKRQTLSDDATSALIALLSHKNENVRECAAKILSHQQQLSDHTTSILIALLQHGNILASMWAAAILAHRQTLSDHTTSALSALLQSGDIRGLIKYVLDEHKNRPSKVGPPSNAVPQDENNGISNAAALVTSEPQALSTQPISTCITALEDENQKVRQAAVEILGKQETLSDETLAALMNLLRHENEETRGAAVKGFGLHKALPQWLIVALVDGIQDADKNFRNAAARVLSFHLDRLYPLLPSLAADQIQILYRRVFLVPMQQIVALYIQENHLCFHTAAGPKSIRLEVEQVNKVNQAFIAVQNEAQLALLQKEK